MNYKERNLNQSLISRFLYKGDEKVICPKKIYNVDIISSHKYRTESMLKGSYFETLCLGRGAGNRMVDDLPRKQLSAAQQLENKKRELAGLPLIKGNKTTDQIRIEEQATRFKILVAKYQITLTRENTQVRVVIPWGPNPEVFLSAEFDIFPTAIITNEGLKFALIDLKLTADVNATFGEYCWGAPEYLDPIQALMYHYMVREVIKYPNLNPHIKDLLTKPAVNLIKQDGIEFYYWVFNYKKTTLEDKLIKVKWDKTRESELHESINKTISLIDQYEALGWPTNPDYRRCKDCPVFECPDKQNIQSI